MTRRSVRRALALVWALVLPSGLWGQTVPGAIEALPADVAEAWIAPLPRALGPAMITGFFADARPGPLRLGVRLALGRFDGRHEAFVAPLPASVSFEGTTYAEPYQLAGGPTSPTVAGRGPGAAMVPRPGSTFEAALMDAGEDPAAHSIPLPPGTDLPGAPVPSVDLSLGIGSAGAVAGRFFPRLDLDDDLGDMGGFGIAVLLSIDRFVPLPRLDAALTLALQRMEVGGYLDTSATATGLLLSTGVGPLRIHAHGQRASWEADLRWRTRNPSHVAGLPTDGAVQILRFDPGADLVLTLGASVDLSGGGVTVEVSPATPRILSAHLTLARR